MFLLAFLAVGQWIGGGTAVEARVEGEGRW